MFVVSNSPQETEEYGKKLAQKLVPGNVIAFTGGLGAGKTTFTRGLARGLGVKSLVTSPTYTIVNEYEESPTPLIHFDLYRLQTEEELFEIGWDEYLERGGILVLEWAENGKNFLPKDTIWVEITPLDENRRQIQVSGLQEGA